MKSVIISKSYLIETDRLLLRIPSLDDIPVVLAATKFKGFNDGMLWDPPKEEKELVLAFENTIRTWENNEGYSFSIVLKVDNLFIGRISIRKEPQLNIWNIGFWTHPKHQNKGYATEATKAILKFGFQELLADKINACHALWNKGSEKVLKHNGMKFSRFIEKGFQKNGEWISEKLLEISKIDWRKLNAK